MVPDGFDLYAAQSHTLPVGRFPALWLGDRLDFFGDVFPLLVDMDAVEVGPVAGYPGGVARV